MSAIAFGIVSQRQGYGSVFDVFVDENCVGYCWKGWGNACYMSDISLMEWLGTIHAKKIGESGHFPASHGAKKVKTRLRQIMEEKLTEEVEIA